MVSHTNNTPILCENDIEALEKQNTRLVPPHKAEILEKYALKHWDLFYKRNETRFFKDRHWTTREFTDLLNETFENKKILLEVGCGVGNFVFPLIEERLNLFIYACDFSPRAINFVKSHKLYNEQYIKAFQADVTNNESLKEVNNIDIVTLIFVLSAIHPQKFPLVLKNILNLLKPGGVVLFRDYGLYDRAQLRFKPGNKISDNFYMRQDGTRSYYFQDKFLSELFQEAGFMVEECNYVERRTVNKKEGIDVLRTFIQGKFTKPK